MPFKEMSLWGRRSPATITNTTNTMSSADGKPGKPGPPKPPDTPPKYTKNGTEFLVRKPPVPTYGRGIPRPLLFPGHQPRSPPPLVSSAPIGARSSPASPLPLTQLDKLLDYADSDTDDEDDRLPVDAPTKKVAKWLAHSPSGK
ncbi:hypothetical protein B0H10DRAFT_1943683 [Mycena sp. CBHHK59/15]|nr:hypothetical protein B0H10DRAFT_1943683 [Mycena sp. CBHHK59/15]